VNHRPFRLFPQCQTTVKVSKIVDDSQNQKLKTRSKKRSRKLAESQLKPNPPLKQKPSQDVCDPNKSFNLSMVVSQRDDVFFRECDTSIDLLKDLGLEQIESTFEDTDYRAASDEEYQT